MNPVLWIEKDGEKRDVRERTKTLLQQSEQKLYRVTPPSGARHRDSLLGLQRTTVNEINLLKIN